MTSTCVERISTMCCMLWMLCWDDWNVQICMRQLINACCTTLASSGVGRCTLAVRWNMVTKGCRRMRWTQGSRLKIWAMSWWDSWSECFVHRSSVGDGKQGEICNCVHVSGAESFVVRWGLGLYESSKSRLHFFIWEHASRQISRLLHSDWTSEDGVAPTQLRRASYEHHGAQRGVF